MITSRPTIQCLIISPSDVAAERDAITDFATEWNAHTGAALECYVEPVRFETHATLALTGPPQELLDKQIVAPADMGVAIFWSRVGTPTNSHQSGSVEEIERLLAAGKPVIAYFCDRPVPVTADLDQLAKVRSLRERLSKRGLVHAFSEPHELTRSFGQQLATIVRTLLASQPGSSPSALAGAWAVAQRFISPDEIWKLTAAPLTSRAAMYTEIARLLRDERGDVHVRATSALPNRDRTFDEHFWGYIEAAANACAAAVAKGCAASYTLITGGAPPHTDDKAGDLETLLARYEVFVKAKVETCVTVFHMPHPWLLDVLTINDKHMIIGFPLQASDPHLGYAVRISGIELVAQIRQWFDTCVLPFAQLIDIRGAHRIEADA